MKVLLTKGAPVDALDIFGKTPLMEASSSGHSQIMEVIHYLLIVWYHICAVFTTPVLYV